MTLQLPSDLFEAESNILFSLEKSLEESQSIRLSINLNFEGLRILPIALRLAKSLNDLKISSYLVFSDAGTAALAKREAPYLIDQIFSFNQLLETSKILDPDILLVCVSPQYFDYKDFEALCNKHVGKIAMLNGKLEEPSVGIGTVARDRRKGLLSIWDNIFWLEPLKDGALMRAYPSNWNLYKSFNSEYYYLDSFETKPDNEQIFEAFL